jgi:hypothetical protein
MARYRTIKPKFYNDRALSKCSIQARYLFKALWVFADDLGVIINEPNWIKSQVFPYDSTLRVEDVVKWLDALVIARMIEPFTFKGESFYNIRSFRAHQKIDRPNLDDVHVPENQLDKVLNDLDAISSNANSTINRRTFDDASFPEKSQEEKSREEKNACADVEIIFPFVSDEFKTTWEHWKAYKKKELKFHFKSPQSEQASLNDLVKKSNGIEETAIAIIQQSMANGWKGFFELKKLNNGGSSNHNNRNSTVNSEQLDEAHAAVFGRKRHSSQT